MKCNKSSWMSERLRIPLALQDIIELKSEKHDQLGDGWWANFEKFKKCEELGSGKLIVKTSWRLCTTVWPRNVSRDCLEMFRFSQKSAKDRGKGTRKLIWDPRTTDAAYPSKLWWRWRNAMRCARVNARNSEIEPKRPCVIFRCPKHVPETRRAGWPLPHQAAR